MINKEKFEFYDDLTEKEYDIEVGFTFEVDHNYGSDADGNRGTYAEWIEISYLDIYFEKKDVTKEIEKNPDLYAAIEEEALKAAESFTPVTKDDLY